MSFNRENVVWQSADGTWSRGFYTVTWQGYESDGYDPEWDVEYDFDSFEWVSTGHKTLDSALASWDGANPGGFGELTYGEQWAGACDKYDDMAKACKEKK